MTSNHIRLLVMLGIVSLLLGCTAAQPLRRSTASIRASLLKRTPVGTSFKNVEAFVKKEGWQTHSEAGLRIAAEQGMAGAAPTQEVSQTMQVFLGHYSGLLPFYMPEVRGYWVFDTNNQLIEVCVVKHIVNW